jgi:hypothetical protein
LRRPEGRFDRALTRIAYQRGTIRDSVFVAEPARTPATLNDALNSAPFVPPNTGDFGYCAD